MSHKYFVIDDLLEEEDRIRSERKKLDPEAEKIANNHFKEIMKCINKNRGKSITEKDPYISIDCPMGDCDASCWGDMDTLVKMKIDNKFPCCGTNIYKMINLEEGKCVDSNSRKGGKCYTFKYRVKMYH